MRNKEIMETLLMIEKLRSLGFSVSAPAPRTMPELRTQRWREGKKQA